MAIANLETQTLQKCPSWPLIGLLLVIRSFVLFIAVLQCQGDTNASHVKHLTFHLFSKTNWQQSGDSTLVLVPCVSFLSKRLPWLCAGISRSQTWKSILISQHTCWRYLETGFDSHTADWVTNLLQNWTFIADALKSPRWTSWHGKSRTKFCRTREKARPCLHLAVYTRWTGFENWSWFRKWVPSSKILGPALQSLKSFKTSKSQFLFY